MYYSMYVTFALLPFILSKVTMVGIECDNAAV